MPSIYKGPFRMLFSSLCFAMMAYFVKLASSELPGSEIAFIRFGIGVGTALILAACGRINLHTSEKKLLIVRGAFGGISIFVIFFCNCRWHIDKQYRN